MLKVNWGGGTLSVQETPTISDLPLSLWGQLFIKRTLLSKEKSFLFREAPVSETTNAIDNNKRY